MKPRAIINVFTTLGMISVNALAVTLPLNHQSTKEISDRFPVLFTPAGYVFSIWGIIYLGMIAYSIYQALPSQQDNPRLERVGWWFSLSNLLNAGWIFLWHYNFFTLSLLVMFALLGSLLMVYTRLGIGAHAPSRQEMWLVNVPFSIYLGWISVATIANFSVSAYNLGWNGFGAPVVFTLAVLAVGITLGALMITRRHEIAYPLVLVWAFIGIYMKQHGGGNQVVAIAGLVAAGAIAGFLIAARTMKNKWVNP